MAIKLSYQVNSLELDNISPEEDCTGYVKFDDLGDLQTCYFTAKEDPSVLIIPYKYHEMTLLIISNEDSG